MQINEILQSIEQAAKRDGISKPFLVGGVPRDRILGKREDKTKINDLDITTGNKDAAQLAGTFASMHPDSNHRTYDDGHSSVDVSGIKVDFSSNFISPGVRAEMKRLGATIDSMRLELYSRDFTINTILEDTSFESIYDLTGQGVNDIRNGIIRCPINPNITIGVDPRRMLRAIKFSVKYGFKIEEKLQQAILDHRKKISTLPKKFVQNKVNEIVLLDPDDGIEQLIHYKLLPLVPLTKAVSDILIQKRKLVSAL